jgi:C-terminal processing protease CtpA/Prc
MQKILKWFTPVLALGVAIFIIFFLISINPSQELDYVEPIKHKSEVVQQKSKKVWLNHFSKTERLGYFYPVNEAYIEIDLEEEIISNTIYKLSASLLDPYQLFCLKEELKQHKLRYYLKRDKNSIELLIYSKNIKKLNSLVRVLKNYQISAQVELHKED